MITPKQFNNGQCIVINNEIFVVLYKQHKRTAQRGAVVRTKLKNLKTGAVSELNLDPDAAYEEAYIEKKEMQFLYHDGDVYYFMDQSTYEQFEMPREALGNAISFLKENINIVVGFYEGKLTGVELPIFIDLKVTYTEPGLRGDTAKASAKPATLETGAIVKVPLFINEGDIIRIDTRTGEYASRI